MPTKKAVFPFAHKAYFSGSVPIDYNKDENGHFRSKILNIFNVSGIIPSDVVNSSAYISINHNSREYRHFLKSNNSQSCRVLIRTEPITVFPAQYTRRIEEKYDLVFTFGIPKGNHRKFINLNHPYDFMKNPNLGNPQEEELTKILYENGEKEDLFGEWEKRKYFLTLIAANKVSCLNDNNYRLRRKFAKKLTSEQLALFGGLWNESLKKRVHHRLGVATHAIKNGTLPNPVSLYGSLFTRYGNHLGMPEDKHEVIRQSKFSLVIENSNTYVSEKLFDALLGGSIPVYFGPDLDAYGLIDDDLVLRYVGPVEELVNELDRLGESEIRKRLNAIQDFLRSRTFRENWQAKSVYEQTAIATREYLDSREMSE